MPESATTLTRYSKTTAAVALSMLTGIPALVDQIQLLDLGLSEEWKKGLALVSVFCLWLAPILARHSAVEAVQAVESKVATVAATTAAVVDPETETPESAADTLRAVAESSKP
jgi:hypothetical protein